MYVGVNKRVGAEAVDDVEFPSQDSFDGLTCLELSVAVSAFVFCIWL
jgi:hypothetical protein